MLVACAPEPTPAWHQESGYRWREAIVPKGAAGFTRMESGKTGIQFQNFASDSVLLKNRILGQGAGVSLGDVDGDGLADIFLAKTEGCSALYRNLGNWRFEDITKRAGVGACDRHSTGTAFADVDGDGDLDLVLHFRTQQTNIECGTDVALLRGASLTGELIGGWDTISTVGCK